jgi:hypothetical protein
VHEDLPRYWQLIAVLFSSFPLTPQLAMRLHRHAYELYRTDQGNAELDTDGDGDTVVSGEIRSLGQDVAVGTITGPAFEARLDTERGEGVVRFVLTRNGIEMLAERARAAAN